ncbi:MAG: HPF/RaiA family ribosome-associated protein [Planctomycetaceae bacterium]|nr:HPF/RaiA family ribosome-associated protein [Planctomycetaceae bacterium]MCA9022987.1 HPF/RaiA family ribosome-associated protein [Planctomycetaceae bacterium]
MTITFTDRNQLLTHQLKQLCERRLNYALSRFQLMIKSIEFCVSDLNGPRGGIDKACRVMIRHRSGQIIVNHKHEDLNVCISKVAEKATRAISRNRARSKKFKRSRHTDLQQPELN